jgi:hypothetical protein
VVRENGMNKLRKKKNRKKSTRIRDQNGEERKIKSTCIEDGKVTQLPLS